MTTVFVLVSSCSPEKVVLPLIFQATFVGMFIFKHISGTHIFLNLCLTLLLFSHLCLVSDQIFR